MKKFIVFTLVLLPIFFVVSCKEKVEKTLFDEQIKINDSLRIELNSKLILVDSLSIQVTQLSDKISAMKANRVKNNNVKTTKKKTTKKKTKK